MAYTRINKDCPHCGNKMDNRAKQCEECYLNSLKGKNNPNFGNKYAKIYRCIDCKKEVNYGYKRCHPCAAKYNWEIGLYSERTMIGENNPNYINGLSNLPYPLEFNDSLKDSIRKRDNYKCQNCGLTNEEHLITYDESLPVHHIDYNKQNCKENNLITTCKQCNVRANYNRNHWIIVYTKKIMEIIHV